MEVAVFHERHAPTLYTLSSGGDDRSEVPLTSSLQSPLGSVWKLFVFFYLAENKFHPPKYTCAGLDKEELFCCKPKESIEMDEALFKSCGLYFSPERLSIGTGDWVRFWSEKVGVSFGWLVDFSRLHPGTTVSVQELLQALNVMKKYPVGFDRLNSVLARVTIDGTAKGTVRQMGTTLRVKTFTWDDPDGKTGKYLGGFAGWLQSGSPIWARASGTSAQVLSKWAKKIEKIVGTERISTAAGDCVEVSFFDKYPIKQVLEMPRNVQSKPGVLRGKYRIIFENRKELEFVTNGQLRVSSSQDGTINIVGHFGVNDYVARVIDREISAFPVTAARAFSVAIRTYLYQNARLRNGCYSISDSTHTQRIAVNAPSDAAVRVAAWSDGLILDGVPDLRYHATQGSNNVLSWSQAKEMGQRGESFDQILKVAYPAGRLMVASARGGADCEKLPRAEKWIKSQLRVWSRKLVGVSGFQPPEKVGICLLKSSQPYSDAEHDLMFLRFSGDLEDQLTVAHEYLHLAFKRHPNGINEEFIESKAHELVQNQGQAGNYDIE